MTIQHIPPGFVLAPESASTLDRLFDTAASELEISLEDEEAKAKLAKLILEIASPLTELTEDHLLDKVTAAWGWQNPPTR
jgi:hypothetical protein